MSYNCGKGLYQNRADCYINMECNENKYLQIFHCVWRLYNFDEQKLDKLEEIRDTRGLARCWGYASAILKAVDENLSDNEIKELVESLLNKLLEVMPAYVDWYPTADLPVNQPLVKFLQDRSNIYRADGNPKFYAYDNAIKSICKAEIPVTETNCRLLKGIGPRINEHIVSFFDTPL